MKKRKEWLEEMGAFGNRFIEDLPDLPAYNDQPVNEGRLRIGPGTHSLEEILKIYKEEVIGPGIKASSGGHLGYIPAGGIYTSALADFLAAVSNEYSGVEFASPGGVAIENEVIRWLKKIFSFPESAVGNLTSGGSIANLIGIIAARDHHGIKNEKIRKSVVYLSEQAHHSNQKALRLIGLEDVILRSIRTDDGFRMRAEDLKEKIQKDRYQGLHPFLIIASAGTTNVGAVDPLDSLADIAEENNLWLHVDAAYGGFFILSSKKATLKGIERADSIVVDPHKGMFLPYGSGAVLVKDASAVLHSNLLMADYMQDAQKGDLIRDPANVSPEQSRHFRGLRFWLPLQLHGVEPFITSLEEKLVLTIYFRQELEKRGFKIGPEPDLSISYFWYPSGKDENAFNERLLQRIHADGRVFFSSTVLNGKFVIRIALLSFRTKKATVDRALEMIDDCLKSLASGMGESG